MNKEQIIEELERLLYEVGSKERETRLGDEYCWGYFCGISNAIDLISNMEEEEK